MLTLPSPALQAHETIIRTSFRRRFDMRQVAETLAAPRPLTGAFPPVSRTPPAKASPTPLNPPPRVRDVVLRSTKEQL